MRRSGVALARAYVAEIRRQTGCRHCGATPVEFHRDAHLAHPHWRIANLVTAGASRERIDHEIAQCEPLCRRCHMRLDGRLAHLAAQPHPITPPTPCHHCGHVYKPLHKGLCRRCYQPYVPRFTAEERREHNARRCRARNAEGWMRQVVSAHAKARPRDARGVWIKATK